MMLLSWGYLHSHLVLANLQVNVLVTDAWSEDGAGDLGSRCFHSPEWNNKSAILMNWK